MVENADFGNIRPMFETRFLDSALVDLEFLKKFEQLYGIAEIEQHLSLEPATPTRRRKLLRPNDLDPREGNPSMKTIDAARVSTFSELLDLAEDETVLVTTPDGREFIVAEIDDFDEEIEAVSQNRELMALLEERSKEKATGGLSLADVKKRLGLD